ncbi:MAG TPA: DUF5947 family protein [Tepidisphaeraceae bacterium]|jgi:hypothetical protein
MAQHVSDPAHTEAREPPAFAHEPLPAIAALQRFAARKAPAAERCDLCGADIGPEHPHLFGPVDRQLVCACDTCAILFGGQHTQRYKRVPTRTKSWPSFRLPDETWVALGLPIDLAFFTESSSAGKVLAFYPSPAGATESLLTLESWRELVDANPCLRQLEPDVEALLVNRARGAREYYRAPIDQCYRLTGLLRTHWRGLSGGADVWKAVGAFFEELRQLSM